jgi:hypothetical protein
MAVSLAAPSAYADTTTITPQITLVAANALTYDHQTTMVTGTVTGVWPDGTTRPLTDQGVQITCYNACTGGNVTTDDAGHFAVPVTARWWQMYVSASIYATDTVASSSAQLDLTPHSDVRITASADPSTISASSPSTTFSGSLEYLGDDSFWKPLPDRTIQISQLFPIAMSATAYYRAEIVAAPYYKGSTSSVLKVGRTLTRIAGVKVSATRVKKNTYFTIKGTLQRYSSGWKALTGQRVQIVFHIKGSTALHLYSTPLTGSGGTFTAKIKATREAYWVPTYAGATGYYAYPSSKYIHVTLR